MKPSIFFVFSILGGSLAFMPDAAKRANVGFCPTSTCVGMFFADESPTKKEDPPNAEETANNIDPESIDLVSSQSDRYINMVGAFLVDNFWLNSRHHEVSGDVSDSARRSLVVEQSADLQEKYGEQMGRRLLEGQLLSVLDSDSKEMMGVATLKATLMVNDDILESERAESLAKTAVGNLGPKERREYKNASIQTIATDLLSEDSKAVVLFSNLAVAGAARKKGIARYICEEVEGLAKSWGYPEVWLVVESENIAARKLYEKIGYNIALKRENDSALRADPMTGEFVEIEVESIVMTKRI